MNDFLGSLIVRNLAQAETLLPRPVSWFEPRAPDLSPAARAHPEPVAGQEDPDNGRELPWLESADTIFAPPPFPPRRPQQRPSQASAPPVSLGDGVAETVATLPAVPIEPASRAPRPAPSSRQGGARPAGGTAATSVLPEQTAPRAPDHAPEATTPPAWPDQAPAPRQAASTLASPVAPSSFAEGRAASQPPAPASHAPQPVAMASAASSLPAGASVVAPAAPPAPQQPGPSSLAVTPRPAPAQGVERPAGVIPAPLRMSLAPPAQRLAPVESSGDHEPPATAGLPAGEAARRSDQAAAPAVLAPLAAGGNAAASAVQPVVRVAQVASLRPAPDSLRGEQRPGPATPEPPPTIQVTIGRIEVRATPAPAAPPASRRAAPAMSLDEYLRQRSQGGRR